jgi:hypothetical protein
MHAVVVSVTIDDFEESGHDLRERLVPAIERWPGFVAGYWVAFDGHESGRAVTVWQSEDAARQAVSTMEEGAATDPGVTFESIEVGEVVAQAQA